MHGCDELRVDRLIAVPVRQTGPPSATFQQMSLREHHQLAQPGEAVPPPFPRRAAASFNHALQPYSISLV
jgi:hypothetical protein